MDLMQRVYTAPKRMSLRSKELLTSKKGGNWNKSEVLRKLFVVTLMKGDNWNQIGDLPFVPKRET